MKQLNMTVNFVIIRQLQKVTFANMCNLFVKELNMTVCFGFYRSTFSSFCNIDVNFLNFFSINNQVFIYILTFKSVLITFDNFCCFFSTASFFICVAALLATSFSTVSSKSIWIYIKTEGKPLKSKVIPMLWNMRRKKHLQIMTMFLLLRVQPF